VPYDPIEQEIVNVLTIVSRCGYDNWWGIEADIGRNRKWTLAVLGAVGAIGRRKGYSQCFSLKSKEAGEIEKGFIIQVLTKIQGKLGQTLYNPETDRFAAPQWFGEFLYDFTWLQYDIDYRNIHLINEDDFLKGNNRIYNRVKLLDAPLVLESEWGNFSDVKEDFEKLLLARSKYKFMVFNLDVNNGLAARQLFNSYLEKFKSFITQYKYTQSGDRYLFCGTCDYNIREFLFDQYTHP